MPENFNDSYSKDKIRAVDAKYEAQKIAFAPLAFQAARALLELGILKAISDSGEKGLSFGETAEAAGISVYGAKVLLEIALGMNLVKVPLSPGSGQPSGKPGSEDDRFVLGKIGWFLLEDEMTRVNFNFVNDVCYKGAYELTRSVKTGKPAGLEIFGVGEELSPCGPAEGAGSEGTGSKNPGWATIYEALSSLPAQVKESWFAFDHFYSDIGFEEALPIVFSSNPKKIIDIGGNTAKWAVRCCRYDPQVEVIIVDLPGQTAMAEKEIALAGFSGRIKTLSCNVLDKETVFPPGADIIWMSQFLDCFSPEKAACIMAKVRAASDPDTDVYILEPIWDKQRFAAASFSLQATSLYFTCMANGDSKMYRYGELAGIIESSGFEIADAWHDLGSNNYSLLRCRLHSEAGKK